jgi:serine phosphatase RsbU (regulator of sigma subunit)
MRELVPDGQWRQLSDQERQRIRAMVDERLLGIVPGRSGSSAAGPVGSADPAGADAAAQRSRRRTVVSGSHVDVVEESNGQVVHQAGADLNLSNLLGTLFTATARDRGEIPFALASDGQMYAPSDAERERLTAIGVAELKPSAPLETTVLDDWMVVALGDQAGLGLTFGIARPMGDSFRELRSTTMRNAGIGLGFIALAFIGIVPISSRLTRNLETLTEGARRIAAGDFRARVDVTSRDEVGRLAETFNQMAAAVERHEAAAVQQERIRKELELGRRIQHDMLPRGPLRFGLSEITGVSVPAREVGGDFFNYFQLESGEVALVVGDVSGKGVGAALLMANLQASLRSRLALGQDLAALAHQLDVDAEGATPGELYATLFVGVLDPATRELRYVNAGHHPQYVLRQGGGLERMTATGLPIGLLAGRPYEERRLTLQPADVLFFYTDGCIEAENEAGDMLDRERLEAILASSRGSDDVLAHVEAAVRRFSGRREPSDDTAMMVARIG